MEKKVIAPKVIEALENIKARPKMYFGEEPGAIFGFVVGFYLMMRVVGIEFDHDLMGKVTAQHGWNPEGSFGPIAQMKRKGYDEETIIQESLSIDIAYWKEILAQEQKTDSTVDD